MARTTSDILIDASAGEIMTVIADFESYPTWATGVNETEILATNADGRADQVHFVLDAAPIRDEYVLNYEWQGDDSVSWTLDAPGSILKAMDGAYQLDDREPATLVTYQLFVDVSIPLLGMLKRKAEKVIIDTALKGLKRQVEGGDGSD